MTLIGKSWLILLCTLSLAAPLSASENKLLNELGRLPERLYQDGKHYFTAPLRWNSSQRKNVLLTSLGIGLLTTIDDDIQHQVIKHSDQLREKIAAAGDSWTEFKLSGALMGGLWITGAIWEKPRWRNATYNMMESVGLSLLSVELLKKSFSRCRPNQTDDPQDWFEKDCGFAFVSGHASIGFAMATALVESFPDSGWWLPGIAYGLAGAGAYARLHDNKHWMSDVVAGGLIGHYTARFVAGRHRAIETHLLLLPQGVGLQWRW